MIAPNELQRQIDRLTAFREGELAAAAGQLVAFQTTITAPAPLAVRHLNTAASNMTITVLDAVDAALDCLKSLRDGGRE